MAKINNTQRTGLVRQLNEITKKLESQSPSWYSYTKWGRYSGDQDAEIVELVRQWELKYGIAELKKEEQRIDRELTKAVESIEAGLKEFNNKRALERKEKLAQLAYGIRDIWASETMEDAKSIVGLFVE